jgi:hypothetical protein
VFSGLGPVLGLYFTYVRREVPVDLLNGHNALRIHLHVLGLWEDLTCRNGK